jgi:signal transduction histidine kinase
LDVKVGALEMTLRFGDQNPDKCPGIWALKAVGSPGDPFILETSGLGPEALYRLASPGLTGLAHDMGLQIVASALSIIDRSVTQAEPARVQGLCRNARTAVDRIVTLRSQILDLARVEPTHIRRIDPVATISSLKGLIELTLGPAIALEIEHALDAPALVCDAQELENAILNLVVNARDAMPLGGRLSLNLNHNDVPWPDGGVILMRSPRLILKVGDTGCGMPPGVLDRVFEPFFSTKPKDRGTGLGLPMVAEFVRRAGGSVEIQSRVGEGTTVILNLPGCSH